MKTNKMLAKSMATVSLATILAAVPISAATVSANSSGAYAVASGSPASVSVGICFAQGSESREGSTEGGTVSASIYASEFPELGEARSSYAMAWENGVLTAEAHYPR